MKTSLLVFASILTFTNATGRAQSSDPTSSPPMTSNLDLSQAARAINDYGLKVLANKSSGESSSVVVPLALMASMFAAHADVVKTSLPPLEHFDKLEVSWRTLWDGYLSNPAWKDVLFGHETVVRTSKKLTLEAAIQELAPLAKEWDMPWGKIKDNPKLAAVYLSGMRFKANWKNEVFKVDIKGAVHLHMEDTVFYRVRSDAMAVSVPTDVAGMEMLFLVPQGSTTLTQLAVGLSADRWVQWVNDLQETYASLDMPNSWSSAHSESLWSDTQHEFLQWSHVTLTSPKSKSHAFGSPATSQITKIGIKGPYLWMLYHKPSHTILISGAQKS